VVGHAFDVERRVDLREVFLEQPNRRREDVVFLVVEVIPAAHVEPANAAVREVAHDERVADLRAQRHVGEIAARGL
jgi:hypothetical protein